MNPQYQRFKKDPNQNFVEKGKKTSILVGTKGLKSGWSGGGKRGSTSDCLPMCNKIRGGPSGVTGGVLEGRVCRFGRAFMVVEKVTTVAWCKPIRTGENGGAGVGMKTRPKDH